MREIIINLEESNEAEDYLTPFGLLLLQISIKDYINRFSSSLKVAQFGKTESDGIYFRSPNETGMLFGVIPRNMFDFVDKDDLKNASAEVEILINGFLINRKIVLIAHKYAAGLPLSNLIKIFACLMPIIKPVKQSVEEYVNQMILILNGNYKIFGHDKEGIPYEELTAIQKDILVRLENEKSNILSRKLNNNY